MGRWLREEMQAGAMEIDGGAVVGSVAEAAGQPFELLYPGEAIAKLPMQSILPSPTAFLQLP